MNVLNLLQALSGKYTQLGCGCFQWYLLCMAKLDVPVADERNQGELGLPKEITLFFFFSLALIADVAFCLFV